jgi:hypothetical protein
LPCRVEFRVRLLNGFVPIIAAAPALTESLVQRRVVLSEPADWQPRAFIAAANFISPARFIGPSAGVVASPRPSRAGGSGRLHRLFHRDTLTVQGDSGRSRLLGLVEQQRFRQRELENAFYAEYRAIREHLYATLLAHNGEVTGRFPGTRGRIVRLAQKILDRCIFVFFCEDMAGRSGFRRSSRATS